MTTDGGKAKIGRLSRQKSVMIVESNPLETGEFGVGLIPGLKVENLNHATLITVDEFKVLMKKLESFTSNEELIKYLEVAKNPFLFTSEHLSTMIEVTTSIRTKIGIISLVGPRLIDPKAKIPYFTGLFRYSEEKAAVEEVLKARVHVLTTALFTRRDGIRSFGGRGSGGRHPLEGGRGGHLGRGTRSANWHPVMKPNNYALTPNRCVRPIPSDDSIENGTNPTVFGFDAVLSAIDEPVVKHINKGSTSLDTIQESESGFIREEEEEYDDEDEEYDEEGHYNNHNNESAFSALTDGIEEAEEDHIKGQDK